MDPLQFRELLTALNHERWTEITSTVILIVSILIATASLWYARKQLLAEDTRSRRRLAIEMCRHWAGYTTPETSSVTRLVEKMNPNQCEAIAKANELTILADYHHHLTNILQGRFGDIEEQLEEFRQGENYVIPSKYVQHIRYIAVRYLNMLESVLMTWTSGVVDQEMIEQEFEYLFNEQEGRTAMEPLRAKVGREAFPAIEQFVEALRERARSNTRNIRRPPII